jgi:hypothetical protein
MEQIAIKKLQILHDRTGRILAAVHDGPLTVGMPTVGTVPRVVRISSRSKCPRLIKGFRWGSCFPGFNYARAA